jgi:hypothetical protein
MRNGIYDPEKTSLIVGTRQINNFASGTFISAAYQNPKRLQAMVGARGEYGLKRNANRSGLITIVLQPEALENSYLMSLANAESIFPILATRIGETLRDIATAPEGWIEESPNMDEDADEPNRTWIIGVGRLDLAFLAA